MNYLTSDSMIIMPAEAAAMYPYYDLTVTLLLDLDEPVEPIWRRFLISATASLLDLHQAIQVASGSWQDYHLFQFQAKPGFQSRAIASDPESESEWDDEEPAPSAKSVKVAKVFGKTPGNVVFYVLSVAG